MSRNGFSEVVERDSAPPSRVRRVFAGIFWYLIPTLAILFAASYVTLAIVWHVNPPIVPVQGQSMKPYLVTGDLVILHGVDPAKLHKGEVIAVSVPLADQQKYNLPASVVHRIVRITHTLEGGYIFQTKGDANGGPDVFETPAANVIGLMVGKVPGAGYPILFFKSRQGEIFLAVAALVAIGYFLLGWIYRRQDQDPAIEILETISIETSGLSARLDQISRGMASGERGGGGSDMSSAGRMLVPYRGESRGHSYQSHSGEPVVTEVSLHKLAESVNESLETGSSTNESVRELLEAMREYAEHLRSHTAAVQGMSQASMDLAAVAAALRSSVGGGEKYSVQDDDVLTAIATDVEGVVEAEEAALTKPEEQPVIATVTEEPPVVATVTEEPPVVATVTEDSDSATVRAATELTHVVDIFVPRDSARFQLSVELDLGRILKIAGRATRKPWSDSEFSPAFAHIAWAAASSFHLSGIHSNLGGMASDRNVGFTLEVEKVDVATARTNRFIIDATGVATFSVHAEPSVQAGAGESTCRASSSLPIKMVDLSGSGALLALPGDYCTGDQIVVTVGDIRRVPSAISNEFCEDELIVRSVSIVTISAPARCTLDGMERFLKAFKNLTE